MSVQAKSLAMQEHLPEEQYDVHLWTISRMAFWAGRTSVVVGFSNPSICFSTHLAGDPAVDPAVQWLLMPMPLFGHGLSKCAASELQVLEGACCSVLKQMPSQFRDLLDVDTKDSSVYSIPSVTSASLKSICRTLITSSSVLR